MNENAPQNVSKLSDDDAIGIIKVSVYLKSKWKFLLVFLFMGFAFCEAAFMQVPQVSNGGDSRLFARETANFGAYEVLEQGGVVLSPGSVEDAHLKQNIVMRSADTGFYANLFNNVRQLYVVLASEVGYKSIFVAFLFLLLYSFIVYWCRIFGGKVQNNMIIRSSDDKDLRRGYFFKHRSKGLRGVLKNGAFSDELVVNVVDYFYVLRTIARVVNPGCLLNSSRFSAFLDAFKDKFDLIVLDTAQVFQCSNALLVKKRVDYLLCVLKHAAHTNESIQDALNFFDRVRKFLYRRPLSSTSLNVMRGTAVVATATTPITEIINQ